MPWRLVHTPIATHVAPEHDIRPHEFIEPCWCWPIVDHPFTNRVMHDSFLPMDDGEEDTINPNPPLSEA